MDQKFRILLELDERWTREGHEYPATMVRLELLQYGLAKGFLKDGEEQLAESDEGVAARALASAQLLRAFASEDVGSILNMSREEHLLVIRKADPVSEEVMPALCAALGETPPPRHERKETLQ